MRFAKYDNPLGKNVSTPLLKPNLREGESIIDLGVANMLREEKIRRGGEDKPRVLSFEEIGAMLGVSTETVKRWCNA